MNLKLNKKYEKVNLFVIREVQNKMKYYFYLLYLQYSKEWSI